MKNLVRFDWAIKYLLRNKANFDVLEGFLSELLNTDIKIEEILESESNKEYPTDKFNRVDLLAKTDKGQHIIIEVQCSSQWDYLNRILYGTSKIVCEHLDSGSPYKKISKIISISIVFFNLGSGKDYLYKGTTSFKGIHFGDTLALNEKEQELYQTPQMTAETPEHVFPEYYLIKVLHFHEKVQSKLDEWVHFLKYGEIKKSFTAKGIQKAAKKLNILRLSEKQQRIYKGYEESLHDDGSFNMMIDMSREEGRKEGQEEGRLAVARSLKKNGMPIQEILRHTELSLEEIEKL